MTSGEIRQLFLEFFQSKQHQIVPSAPIVVKNDPTLMFTNAGMNQFKEYFLGNALAPSARVADTQKCLRVSGKHNDLEEVGVDTYHHTMFEMLGNWSFGNPNNPGAGYFKKEAIAWSWELLTGILNIPKDRLYVTVFAGSKEEGIDVDSEAIEEWKKWIDPHRILEFGKKDNFWEMGDTGPCGPCTEIHVDTRPDAERKSADGRSLVNADHPQVIEIWNNVFIQYNRLKDGSLQLLPARHVDTGMGFERLVRVIQNKSSNYDTDIFTGSINTISNVTGLPYSGSDSKADISFRVLSDHIRAIAFTIADGQLPSNTGAGYVIRRILRRAVRYYYTYLNYQQPLLHQLLPGLCQQFETVFPELAQQESFVTRVIREEEESFLRTLERGLKRIEDIIASSKDSIKGEDAFELYDTYGFPIDLTRLIASEKGITVDEVGFNKAMTVQKQRSRAATAIDTEDWVVLTEGNQNEFVGYDQLESESRVLKYRKINSKGKEFYQIVLNRTPFYAESGGQVGDTGTITTNDQATVRIVDTKKENDLVVHFAASLPESFGDSVVAKVDPVKRQATAVHHSATHLLHAALRKVLGTHVAQKGSLVSPDYLRFDFSQMSRMTAEDIAEVERLVNEKIRENQPVVIRYMSKDEAMKTGAMALFGEKYGDTVRVVTIDPNYSIELCGGTHVAATGELGFLKVIAESAVAAGVRRIEALSGHAAETFLQDQLKQLDAVKELTNNSKEPAKFLSALQEENAALKKQIEKAAQEQLKVLSNELADKAVRVNDVNFIGEVVEAASGDQLKKLAGDLKTRTPNSVIVLASSFAGKANVVIAIDDKVIGSKKLDAGVLIKQQVSPLIKGGGGGQKGLASAGGQDASALHDVIAAVRAQL